MDEARFAREGAQALSAAEAVAERSRRLMVRELERQGIADQAVLAAMGYSITSRSISQEFTPFERTYFMMLMGCICFPILAILQNVSHPAALFAPFQEWKFWVSLLYLGTLSSIGAYTMSSYAITHLPLARTVVFANLTTAVSVLAGVIFLHEHFTWISALCCLVIIIGVWGTQKMAAPQPAN